MNSDEFSKKPEGIEEDDSINMDLWKEFEEDEELDFEELKEKLENDMERFKKLLTNLENAHLTPDDIPDEVVEAMNRNTRTLLAWNEKEKKDREKGAEEESDDK